MAEIKIRRALLSVSDKTQIIELGRALAQAGAELVATGRTANVLRESGLLVTPIEKVSGAPEAFQGRMKTLSFPVCSGILYRRGDPADLADLEKLEIPAIDCVVVNFYPFEKAAAKTGVTRQALVEEIDIGGPTLVRAAAKNAPDVLVLTDPAHYRQVIEQLQSQGGVTSELSLQNAARAWQRVLAYDEAIAREMGEKRHKPLRYGENPHQQARLEIEADSPIAWDEVLTPNELSYNNILDLSAAYALAGDLKELDPGSAGVVIIKHANPCGVAMVRRTSARAQLQALERAWQGDSVSAFGGVLCFTDPLEADTALWLADRFVELVAAPGLAAPAGSAESVPLQTLLSKRKNLKAVSIRKFGGMPLKQQIEIPGGRVIQNTDLGLHEEFRSVTRLGFPVEKQKLARFGTVVCRSLKSNAIALVREISGVGGGMQLLGAGQGQPNRIDALRALAIPRALETLRLAGGGTLSDSLLISDAFFPFRDTVDVAFEAGIRLIVQPGGSIKDAESIAACDENGMSMAFTGVRHFRH